MKLGIFIVLALSCMVFNAHALTFYRLESFLDFTETFLNVPDVAGSPYAWWTPYYAAPSNPNWVAPLASATSYVDSAGSLGGQRDQILGFEVTSDPGTSASLVSRPANGGIGACYYTLGFVGGGYWQWDGVDNVGPNSRPAKANVNPGLGSNTNYVYLPAHAAGGQTVDLTLGGAVKALNFEALTDLDCEYTWDFFDAQNRSAKITIPIVTSSVYRPYQILFSNLAAADIDAGWSGYNSIAAVQLAVYTFQSDTNAIDTEFRNLTFVGYRITGNVVSDCDCNTSNGVDRSVAGQPVTLRSGTGTTPTGNLLLTVNTDSSGNFVITGAPLNTGSYQVCVEAPLSGLNLCTGQTVCRRVDLNNFVDPAALQFVVQQGQTLTPPGDRSITCEDCSDATVACTGVATLSSCAGGSTPITTHTDVSTNTQCVRTITRTFNAGAAGSVTQRIVITDNQAPTLQTPASNQAPPCTNVNPTFQQWLNTFGGATWRDCTSFTVTNDNTGGAANCGSRQVTFTARDPCNNGATSTTATYSLVDAIAPVFNPDASPASAPCDVSGGTDFAAFNAWLANNGGARATDNCGTPTITNDYTPGTITRGCNNVQTVVFTATDSCGQTDTTISTFTITDATGPRITNQPTNPSVTCDGTQNTQFTTWLNNHANLIATDTCTASNLLTWDDDFVGTTVPSGCNTPTTVTFTVFDACRQSSSATATFTVRDTTAPTITTQPTPLVVPCDSTNTNALSEWLADNAGARATDACTTNVAWTNNFGTVIGGNCNSTTVQFTVCDLCATPNCRTITSSYSIQDQQAPTYLTPPQNANAECNSQSASLYQAWLASGANAVLTDNCSPDNIRFTNNAQGAAPTGCFSVKTVTFFAVDACGNSAPPRTAAFTVEDNVAPTIQTFAIPRSVECNPTNNQNDYRAWLANNGGAVATDACATTVSWVNDGPATVPTPTGCTSTITVNFIASDGCSNTASTSATYTIRDSVAPRITTQAQNQASECTDTSANIQSWLNNNGGARATDDCTAVTWTNNFIAISGTCSAGATVTFTARDACGQTASTVATFSINDTQPPVITTPARSTSVACGPDVPGALATFLNTHGGAVADDACQGDDSLVWTNNFSTAPPGCGFRAVTFTVTDPCNRSAQTTASFTVTDTSAPVWDPAPVDLVVECDSDNQIDYDTWLSTRAGSFASDSCAVDLTYNNNAPANAPERCASVTVTFTVEDQCNNVLVGTASFAVVDTLAPTFTIPPQDLVVECDGTLSENEMNAWLNDVAGATAIDLCTPADELAYSHSTTQNPVRDVCLSSTIFTFNVVDSCGNTARDTAAFIIRDTKAPVFSRNPSDATFECDGTGNTAQITNWINTHGGAMAADACQSTIEWTTDYPGAGPTTCQSILVTFTATDECGFRSSRSATLAIEDTADPVFTDVPEDVTLPCDALTDPDHLGYPTATDACAGELIVFYTDSESDLPPLGNCPGNHLILRTFQTVDECANRIEVSQLITVVIARSSGPCDPGDCNCECCPPAQASQCLPSNCRATECRAVPCASSVCTCVEDSQSAVVVTGNNNGVTVRNVEMNDEPETQQQCKPVYIYVNDDDDEEPKEAAQEAGISQQRILVTNKLIERFAKSGASSVAPFIFVILSLLFVLF